MEKSIKEENHDWAYFRKLSLKTGGFGEDRIKAWSYLLHVQKCEETVAEETQESIDSPSAIRRRRKRTSSSKDRTAVEDEKAALNPPSHEQHPDEHQIKLDTDRSFVLYPVGHSDREELQEDLNALITTIFRRHPALSYFQGYHDIITVLFLTLPEEDQLRCAERLSLDRLRDAMGRGLEPLIGLLRILKYLLRLADPEYAALLERNTPLPYFALSNLLTLFSHDVPTLPLIQHVFDYLLSRPPIVSVYLAAVITIARRDEAYRMEEEGEEGMLHSLLSSLPELIDEDTKQDDTLDDALYQKGESDQNRKVSESISDEKKQYIPRNDEKLHSAEFTPLLGEKSDASLECIDDKGGLQEIILEDRSVGENSQASQPVEAEPNSKPSENTTTEEAKSDTSTILVTEMSNDGLNSAAGLSSKTLPLSSSAEEAAPRSLSAPSLDFLQRRHRGTAVVSLPDLLAHADALYEQFPPTHPSLHLSEIIGPKSVIFTWSEDRTQLLPDAEAEALVAHPELVILPYEDPDELPASKEDGDSDQYDSDFPPKKGKKSARRKLHKRRRRGGPPHFGVALDRKTVLTGAAVALGVAVAVYSVRTRSGHGPFDAVRAEREWRKAGRWVSGVLIGGSEKLLQSFGL